MNALTLAPYRRLFHRSGFLLRLPLLLFGLTYLFVVISLSMTGNPSGGVFLYLVLAALGLPFVLHARRANLLREALDTDDTGSGERDAAASAQIVLTEAVAVWVLVEGRANASFRAMFGTQLHARLSAPLARAKNRFRAMLAGGLALAAYAAWWSGT